MHLKTKSGAIEKLEIFVRNQGKTRVAVARFCLDGTSSEYVLGGVGLTGQPGVPVFLSKDKIFACGKINAQGIFNIYSMYLIDDGEILSVSMERQIIAAIFMTIFSFQIFGYMHGKLMRNLSAGLLIFAAICVLALLFACIYSIKDIIKAKSIVKQYKSQFAGVKA